MARGNNFLGGGPVLALVTNKRLDRITENLGFKERTTEIKKPPGVLEILDFKN